MANKQNAKYHTQQLFTEYPPRFVYARKMFITNTCMRIFFEEIWFAM